MQGRRVYTQGAIDGVYVVGPGEYFKDSAGDWRGATPNGLQVWLKNHTVVEHEDGTITVNPSILAQGARTWHGFLERGVWREC